MLLQISAALEYSVSSVPSLIWETEAGGGKLYLGGYKAAVNLRWLAASNTSLIVNTARGLEAVLGPRYRRQLEARAAACPAVAVLSLPLDDDLVQRLDPAQLAEVHGRVEAALAAGSSVLVHCAQGRSRSTAVAAASLCRLTGTRVEEVLATIQTRRTMADPNINFRAQLNQLQADGYFSSA